MSELKNMTLESFAAATISDAPAPGGGSVSAYVGTLGAALAGMMANLTVGKEKYIQVEDEMKEMATAANALCEELMEAMEKDRNSFNGYMAALRMPKETEEQKAVRREAMQNGLKAAAQVPLETAEIAMKIFPISEAVVTRGNKNVVTDGMIAAMLAKTAVFGALVNVKINLASIKDEEFVKATAARVAELEREAAKKEAEIVVGVDI